MKRRNRNSPSSVNQLVMSDSVARNCWSNLRASIIHHVEPAPGPGSARNTKTTSAVPTRVVRESGSSSRTSFHIRNTMIAIDALKMISCAPGTLPRPTLRLTTANARPPPRIHQFTGGRPGCESSIASMREASNPRAASRRASRRRMNPASSTPSTDTTGMIRASL